MRLIPEIQNLKNKIGVKKLFILSVLFFIVSIILYHQYIGTFNHISKRPCSVHIWAQCARASIALNYYKNDMNFFKPQIHKFLNGEGVTGLEFPLVNYIPAICYKLFGFNEMYYRGFVLLSIIIGLLFFFLLLNSYLKNWVISFALIISAYCSPVMAFYSINFMPDVTSLSFALMSWYFFIRFINDQYNIKLFYMFVLFGTLAALVKITSLITLLAIFTLVLLDYTNYFKTKNGKPLILAKGKMILWIFIGILVVILWYSYSFWLTKHFTTESFTMQTALVTDIPTAMDVIDRIMSDHVYEYYPYENYILYLSIIIFLVVCFKLVDRLLFASFMIVTIGNICFVYLLFYQFKDHDYYVIPILTSVFLLLLVFADLLNKIKTRYFKWVYIIFIVIFFFNIKESLVWTKSDLAKRFDSTYLSYFDKSKPYDDLEPKLRRLGIVRTDKTLSGFEDGWCNSLYKMDQLGYTYSEDSAKYKLPILLKNYNFKLLIVSDSVKFNKIRPAFLKTSVLTTHRGILIYKIDQ